MTNRSALAVHCHNGPPDPSQWCGKQETPLEDAVRMASETPAHHGRTRPKKGTLGKGKDADIIALDDNLNTGSVWAMGELVEDTSTLFNQTIKTLQLCL